MTASYALNKSWIKFKQIFVERRMLHSTELPLSKEFKKIVKPLINLMTL